MFRKIRDFIKKLQLKPEHVKKRILWTVVIIFGVVFAVFWLLNAKKNLKEIQYRRLFEGFNINQMKENLNKIPNFDAPNLNDKLKQMQEEIQKQSPSPSYSPTPQK